MSAWINLGIFDAKCYLQKPDKIWALLTYLDKFQPLTLKTTMRNNKLILASVLLCIDYLTSTGIISL